MRYILFLSFFIAFQCTSQTDSIPEGKYGVDYCITDSNGLKQGVWVRVYADGTLYYKGQFKDGKPVGEFRYFHETGELMTIATHKEGGVTETVSYRKKKTVISKGNYVNQKKDGEWLFYDEKGKLRALENYKSDIKSGAAKVYYENGNIAEDCTYENGEREGEWFEYFVDGSLKAKGKNVAGLGQGPIEAYQEPGVLLYTGQLVNGVAVGEWRHYLENGKVKLRILYDDFGVEVRRQNENGEFEKYYESGIPKSYYEYKNGKLHGPFQEFYNKGDFQQQEIIPTEPGAPIEWKETLVNTQVKKEGEYRNGVLDGEVIYYNENGTIEKTEVYEMGILIE